MELNYSNLSQTVYECELNVINNDIFIHYIVGFVQSFYFIYIYFLLVLLYITCSSPTTRFSRIFAFFLWVKYEMFKQEGKEMNMGRYLLCWYLCNPQTTCKSPLHFPRRRHDWSTGINWFTFVLLLLQWKITTKQLWPENPPKLNCYRLHTLKRQ